MRVTVRRPMVAAALIAALALTGCSEENPADFDSAGSGTESAGSSGTPSDGAEVAGSNGGGGVGVNAIDTSQVLAEQTYQIPGTEDYATFGVHSLVVEGDVMRLYLTYSPDFASVSDNEVVTLFDTVQPMKFRPVLVDRENLKEYSVISDSGQDWSADSVDVATVNGGTAVWWGVYAAPEDDIDTFDLRILEGMPEFTDVPITR